MHLRVEFQDLPLILFQFMKHYQAVFSLKLSHFAISKGQAVFPSLSHFSTVLPVFGPALELYIHLYIYTHTHILRFCSVYLTTPHILFYYYIYSGILLYVHVYICISKHLYDVLWNTENNFQ